MRGKVKKRARTREAATQATHSACDNDDNDRQTKVPRRRLLDAAWGQFGTRVYYYYNYYYYYYY